jgi:hypothetical protein
LRRVGTFTVRRAGRGSRGFFGGVAASPDDQAKVMIEIPVSIVKQQLRAETLWPAKKC